MRTLLNTVFMITLLLFLASSCGRSGELGSVNGVPVTTGEYLSVFNNLPADLQVGVLEPGGRLALMEQIVMKRLLLSAWEEDTTVSDGWEELYRVSMLSDSMFNRLGHEFDQAGYMDSLAACGFSGFTLRVVLLDDSLSATVMAEEWNSGNFDSAEPSLVAPWSLADGSSYRSFSGPVHRITTAFVPLLSLETGIAHVLPMYGEWCVSIINLSEGEWIPEDGVTSLGFMNSISSSSPHVILSKGISSLAGSCVVSGTRLVPGGHGEEHLYPVVLVGEDTLTVADILYIMTKADPVNFPGQVPAEVAVFSPPELFMTPEATMWLYVRSIAQRYGLAELALESGVVLPENSLDYVRAESVMRRRVLEASIPDSAGVALWFRENEEMFLLPERRSVLLGYTDTSSVADSLSISSFDQLDACQTLLDSSGVMVPTPPQVEQAFGLELGPEIFAADPGVFSGPVLIDGELVAWFKVVEIVPPEMALLEDVYPQAEMMAASSLFSSAFDSLMDDLNTKYSATIDTAAVVDIDLWGGTQ